MKIQTILVLICLLISACKSNEERVYIKVQDALQVPEGVTEQPLADECYVSVEMVVHADQIAQFPLTYQALEKAILEWSINLPVRPTLYIQDPNIGNMLPFGIGNVANEPGVIEILIADLQQPPYNLNDMILGMWSPTRQKIYIDADFLELNPETAYSVMLHELGHMFGLPHLVGYDEEAMSGMLVLLPGLDATNYVMYPFSMPNKPQDKLSPIEISLAQHHVMHEWTNPNKYFKDNACQLEIQE